MGQFEKPVLNSSLSDKEVIRRVLCGEKELLEVLYDRYATKVFYKCLSITKDKDVSQDLTHDIMVKIFMKLSSFKGTSDFSFWVYSITYNHSMDHLNKRNRLRLGQLDALDYEQVSTADIELEHKLLKEIQLEQLEQHFETLSGEEKMILLMRYQDSMSIKQIATILKIGESAVKMRLKRSRDHLAKLFKKV